MQLKQYRKIIQNKIDASIKVMVTMETNISRINLPMVTMTTNQATINLPMVAMTTNQSIL